MSDQDKCPNCGGEVYLDDTWGLHACDARKCGWTEAADLRRQLKQANEKLDRLHDGGLSGPQLIDDSDAFWSRIDEFRSDQNTPLTIIEQRELAEWWAERGTQMSRLDDLACEAEDKLAQAQGDNKRLREDLRKHVGEIYEQREHQSCFFDGAGDCGNWPTCSDECALRQLGEMAGFVPQEDGGLNKQPAAAAAGETT